MRIADILRYKNILSLPNMAIFTNEFYASPTWWSNWFLNPELIFFCDLLSHFKSFIIMRENVCFWNKIILFRENFFLSLDSLPKFILSSKMPTPWKMIEFLMRVDMRWNSFYLASSNIEKYIPIFAYPFFKPIALKSIHNASILWSINSILQR